MRRRRGIRLIPSLLALALFASACGSGEGSTSGTDSDGSTATYVSRFGVDTSKCPDELVDGPLGTIIPIGTTMPLTGGPATALSPLAAGLEAYADHANEQGLLGDRKIELTVEDDAFDASRTRPDVLKLLELKRVALLTGMVGTDTNLAMRELLNKECYPQLFASSPSAALGDVERFPWTMGGLLPVTTEVALYARDARERLPQGATVALFGAGSGRDDDYARALAALPPESKLDLVVADTADSADPAELAPDAANIATVHPDVVVVAPIGAQCPAFLSALAHARASDPAWHPVIYVSAPCATDALLGAAGADADGVITASSLVDVNDPALADQPAVEELRGELVGDGFPSDGDFAMAAIGWTEMEATVEVLTNADATAGGMTRASIINAARDLSFTPSLARPGVTYTTNGTADPFALESAQLVRWDAARRAFVDRGAVVTDFEGRSGRGT